jgi:hypothetical protein
LTDPVKEPSKGNFGQEIPEVIPTNTLFFLLLETSRKANDFFKLNDARMWKIKFGEEIAFEQQRIPIHTLAQLSLTCWNPARSAQE